MGNIGSHVDLTVEFLRHQAILLQYSEGRTLIKSLEPLKIESHELTRP